MRKVKLGDIFSIDTPSGKGYFQYIFEDETIGELIYIFPGLYLEEPNIKELRYSKEAIFVHFPLRSALKKRIIDFVASSVIHEHLEIPAYFKVDVRDSDGNFIEYQIVDYQSWKRYSEKDIDLDINTLSPWGTWNDTYLVEQLIERWGKKY